MSWLIKETFLSAKIAADQEDDCKTCCILEYLYLKKTVGQLQ